MTGNWKTMSRAFMLFCVVAAGCVALQAAAKTADAATPSGWNIVPSPDSATGANDMLLGTACPSADECWAVGADFGNQDLTAIIDNWNGSTWSPTPLPAPPPTDGYALFAVTCVSDSDCWTVGIASSPGGGSSIGTYTAHWDGAQWSMVPSPLPTGAVGGFLDGISCVTSSDCWAVGYTTDSNGAALNLLVENWNGTAWTLVPGAPSGQIYDQLDGVTCLAANNCWAVGTAGPNQQNPNFLPIFPAAAGSQGLVEHWNGSTWSVVPSYSAPGPAGGFLTGISCVNSSECWASGSVISSAGFADGTLMETWNGTTWSTVATPTPDGSEGDILDAVSCLSADQCWTVGASGSPGGGGSDGTTNGFIDNWNGTSWSVEPSPNVTSLSLLVSVTCSRGVDCWAVGAASVDPQNGGSPGLRTLVEQSLLPAASNQGLYMTARDGGVFAFGNAGYYGSMGGRNLNAPIVDIAATTDGGGYWEVASDGGIFAFGDAGFYGSMGGRHLNAPIVGMAATPDGGGYWEVASDGGIFAFGDAGYYGSMGGRHLNAPVVGIAANPQGGYWEVASDGGIFSFGDAGYYGSMAGHVLNAPVVGIAAAPDGAGYWEAASDGGVFNFGTPYYGSVPGEQISGTKSVIGIAAAPDGEGYWLAGNDGSMYSYGDSAFLGSLVGLNLTAPVSGVATA